MRTLHVTNGDAAAEGLRQADLGGAVLPWRDVLHEGPVPADLAPEALNEVRAGYIAARGWAEMDAVRRSFAERDAVIAQAGEKERIVLWFEHDLYDQLQLLQVLDRLSGLELGDTALELVMIDHHPAVDRFFGLGQLAREHLQELFAERRPVTAEQIELARAVWDAFRAFSPVGLRNLARDNPALAFLGAAVRRHIEQYPSADNGLGRTEQQALEALADGPRRACDLFAAQYEQEESPFLGDSVFWHYIARLAGGESPALTIEAAEPFSDSRLTLTAAGERVMGGEADYIELNGIDRWYGGVHLEGRSVPWRREAAGHLRRQ